MYDIAIVGGGPAGVSAAINAKILNKNFIWFSGGKTSLKASRAELVKNYPGLPDATGEELSWAFFNHAESMNIKITEKIITGVYETDGGFTLLAGAEDFSAKTVVLCIGVGGSGPAEGEEEFLGRGISYCATCDGMLYKGKKIAVVCTDKRYEPEIEYLCSLAAHCAVIPLYKDCKIDAPNAEIVNKIPLKYEGDTRFRRIAFKDGTLAADGAFILKSFFPPSSLMHGLKIEGGHIAVNRAMETCVAGVFAAGDCTGRPYQYAKAVGEGNVAVHSAAEYLAKMGLRR